MKLRKTDKQSDSKVILEIGYMSNNTELNTTIKYLKFEGEVVYCSFKRKELLSRICPDLASLEKMYSVNPKTGASWSDNSLNHYIEQTRKYLGKSPKTLEDFQDEISELVSELNTHKVLAFGGDNLPVYAIEKLRDILKNPMDHDSERVRDYLEKVTDKVVNNAFRRDRLKKQGNDFCDRLATLRVLKKMVQYPSLNNIPSRSEVWTIDRLADWVGCDKSLLMPLFFLSKEELEEQTAALLQGVQSARLKELKRLEKKFNLKL